MMMKRRVAENRADLLPFVDYETMRLLMDVYFLRNGTAPKSAVVRIWKSGQRSLGRIGVLSLPFV